MRRSPLGLAVLALATAAALALGGRWWVSNAPPPAGPVAGPSPPSPTAVRIEPELEDYPDPAEILQFDVDQVERILPEREEVLRREAGVLTDGGIIDYSGPVPAIARFQLEVACLGDGDLVVEVLMPNGAGHDRRLGCDGTLTALAFTAGSTGQAVIRMVARTDRFVGVAVQLAQL